MPQGWREHPRSIAAERPALHFLYEQEGCQNATPSNHAGFEHPLRTHRDFRVTPPTNLRNPVMRPRRRDRRISPGYHLRMQLDLSVPHYSVALSSALPHGVLVAVRFPEEKVEVPEEVIERLHPDEREVARGLNGFRQTTWVAGRLAAAKAIRGFGFPAAPLLAGRGGEPLYGGGLSLSISHKGGLAVALAARTNHGTVGVDLESPGRPRMGIEEKVLTESERGILAELPEGRRWSELLTRFAMKEALYKALYPHVNRYVDFSEAIATPDVNHPTSYELNLSGEEGPFSAEGRILWIGEYLLATANVRPQ